MVIIILQYSFALNSSFLYSFNGIFYNLLNSISTRSFSFCTKGGNNIFCLVNDLFFIFFDAFGVTAFSFAFIVAGQNNSSGAFLYVVIVFLESCGNLLRAFLFGSRISANFFGDLCLIC